MNFGWITIRGVAILGALVWLHTNIFEGHRHRIYTNEVPNFIKYHLSSLLCLLLDFDKPKEP